jgi:hypothetical protein
MTNIPILVYTHSEYSFLWKAAIPLLQKYAKGFPIIWCCDKLDYTLPPDWTLYKYDPSDIWSARIKGCLEQIDSEYLIYLQEDWLLIDELSSERIDFCIEFMKDYGSEFFMSSINNATDDFKDVDGYRIGSMYCHYFQPAIWKKGLLYELACLNIPMNMNESEIAYNITKGRRCLGIFDTLYERDMTTRSFFFPHMHAINKGKWTFLKYPTLKALVEAYGIDTSTREVDTEWMVMFQ